MKFKILIAFIFFILGIAKIIDWFIFCDQNRELKNTNYLIFIAKYDNKFPSWLRPLFNTRPELATVISVVLLSIAGIIFLKNKKVVYKVLAITSFVLAFWNLFSLM